MKKKIIIGLLIVVAIVVVIGLIGSRPGAPETHADIVSHFKYGSVGTEGRVGLPYWIWRVLPDVFPDKLPNRPGQGYERLGFVSEGEGHDRPIGTTYQADRVPLVGLNCATCHVGTVRYERGGSRRIVLGMPANQMDLQGYANFLTACASDPRFNY